MSVHPVGNSVKEEQERAVEEKSSIALQVVKRTLYRCLCDDKGILSLSMQVC